MAGGGDGAPRRDPRGPRGGLARHEARHRALEVLYEADLRRRDLNDTLVQVDKDPNADPLDDFARSLVGGVAAHHAEVDDVISRYARGWRLERMPLIDRNILRLGIYELLHSEDTPPAVVIDEAVELAKALSTEESPRYVNGVLSAVLRDHRGGA